MPPIVLSIIALVQLGAKFAPEAGAIYAEARAVFNRLFNGGLITAAQQQELMDWADNHQAATLRGDVPPELTVEPDPT